MEKKVSKSAFARSTGVSRSSLYYVHKRPLRDEVLKKDMRDVWQEHPAYGHRRMALHLKVNK